MPKKWGERGPDGALCMGGERWNTITRGFVPGDFQINHAPDSQDTRTFQECRGLMLLHTTWCRFMELLLL